MPLLIEIKRFFRQLPSALGRDHVVIGFSGGPDSTALLWGLKQIAAEIGLRLDAIHIDHELDGDSSRRAKLASDLCLQLQVPLTVLRCTIREHVQPGENLEATARRVRYRSLERQRQELGAGYVATAHHADDQIETVLIRILHGSGIEGLAGIQPIHGRVLRPLLAMRREEIHQHLIDTGLKPVQDPTNLDINNTRNRVRHLVLPALRDNEPGIDDLIANLAKTARGARLTLEKRLRRKLDVLWSPSQGGSLDRRALECLPTALWPYPLALLHREAGVSYPPSAAARQELQRQVASPHRVGVSCGGGWRWESHGDRLTLSQPQPSTPGFAYTVVVPGECEIPELALRFRIRRGEVDTWMFRPSSHRAGLDIPIGPGDRVTVRSRREGDRIRPFGCQHTRRLKDVLIDRRVPRLERGRLPLLEVDSRLAWIPGVTIDDSFRVGNQGRAWIAELESI